MTRARLLIALLPCLLPAALAAQDGSPDTPPATLKPWDRATVQVWRNQELSGTLVVGEDSAFVHPVYGAVKVGGATLPEARERVRQFLARFEAEPRFTLIPEFRVYVGGAVRDPNQHYMPQLSVGEAITRVGGSTAPDRRYRVKLVRGGRQYVENLNGGGIAALLQAPIRSGDQIIVEERPTFSRTYIGPALQLLQAVGSIVTTYVLIDQVLGSDDDTP